MIGKTMQKLLIALIIIRYVHSSSYRRSRLALLSKEAENMKTIWESIAEASSLDGGTVKMVALPVSGEQIFYGESTTPMPPRIHSQVEFSKTSDESPEVTTPPIKLLKMSETSAKTPEDTPSTVKSRKNQNVKYFFDSKDSEGTMKWSSKRSKERERNTRPPSMRKRQDGTTSDPAHPERRPALLLRLFPDGTAVLISRFQVRLHVKPKEITFDPEDRNAFEEIFPFPPEVLLNEGKSYEVTYKKLEDLSSRDYDADDEVNEKADIRKPDDLPEKYEHKDHVLVSTGSPTTANRTREKVSEQVSTTTETSSESSTTQRVTTTIRPLEESTSGSSRHEDSTLPSTAPVTESTTASTTTEDSPVFFMHGAQMDSLQRQYEPPRPAPLLQTTESPAVTTQETTSSTPPNTEAPTDTTTSVVSTTVLSHSSISESSNNTVSVEGSKTKSIGCFSFKKQLFLALSTEDNIGNPLLKKGVLPQKDCNTSDDRVAQTTPIGLEIQRSTTPIPILTSPEGQHQPFVTTGLPPRLEELPAPHRLKEPTLSRAIERNSDEPVVVTSLPMMILLQRRRDTVTDVSAWKEVTVGVVRDRQGHPLKPKANYNNWTAHIRSFKNKPHNFWDDYVKTDSQFRPASTKQDNIPAYLQNYQASPSDNYGSFSGDGQRSNADSRGNHVNNGKTPENGANVQRRNFQLPPHQGPYSQNPGRNSGNRNGPQGRRFSEQIPTSDHISRRNDQYYATPPQNQRQMQGNNRHPPRYAGHTRHRTPESAESSRQYTNAKGQPQQPQNQQRQWENRNRWRAIQQRK